MLPYRKRRRLKENQFDDAAFEYCISENFWDSDETARHNAMLILRGYGLLKKRNILRLKLQNALLRKSGKEVIDGLAEELESAEKKADDFLYSNYWH